MGPVGDAVQSGEAGIAGLARCTGFRRKGSRASEEEAED